MQNKIDNFLVKWICDLPEKYWISDDRFKISGYTWDFYLENYDNRYAIQLELLNSEELRVYYTSFPLTSQDYISIVNKQERVSHYVQDKIMEIISDIEFQGAHVH